MRFNGKHWLGSAILVAALGGGWALAACEDPNPLNCPPPRCETCDTVRTGVTVRPARERRTFSLRERGAAWFLLTLRTLAGAARAL